MKTKLFTALVATALAGAPAVFGSGPSVGQSGVAVEFHEPENFTDFRISRLGGRGEQRHLETELTRQIERQSKRYLPPQYNLALRINNIDMAGDFEDFLPVQYQNTRIVRARYLPRIDVEYTVTNEAGDVVQSGSRTLTNLGWDQILRTSRRDETFHEENLLNDFIRKLGRSLS